MERPFEDDERVVAPGRPEAESLHKAKSGLLISEHVCITTA
jgi:hypothetical protein